LQKEIHKKYNTITINECNTSKKCCECNNDLSNYKDSNGKKKYPLLVCSECVRPHVKQPVFRNRDAINIMTLQNVGLKGKNALSVLKFRLSPIPKGGFGLS
jgi:hypothetical protein